MSVIPSQSSVSRLDLWQRTSIAAKPSANAEPSASSPEASGAGAQTQSQPARPSTPPNDLQQALNRGWQDYMQKLRVDLNRPAQRQSQQADDIQKKMLKQQADALRQMMMVTRDKASLRALATQLARLARELKDLVSSMTQNAAGQQMTVNVGGDQASAADASSGSDAGSGGDADAQAASAEASAAASSAQQEAQTAPAAADGSNAQQAASGQNNAQDASEADANAQASGQTDAQGNSGNVDPQAALRNMLVNGNPVAGDPDIQQIRQVLKMVQAFIKQMAQQLQTQKDPNSRELKDDMKRADKDLEDVDKILKGGPEAMAAINGQMDVNINVSVDAGTANA